MATDNLINEVKEPVFLAADVYFSAEYYKYPATELEIYFQKPSNGGGEVSQTLYPWQGDQGRALIIFDAEFCSADVVQTLIAKKKDPFTNIEEFKEAQRFPVIETSLTEGLQAKLLSSRSFRKLEVELTRRSGVKLTQDRDSGVIQLKGYLFQINLADDWLQNEENEIEKQRQNQAEKDSGSLTDKEQLGESSNAEDSPPSSQGVLDHSPTHDFAESLSAKEKENVIDKQLQIGGTVDSWHTVDSGQTGDSGQTSTNAPAGATVENIEIDQETEDQAAVSSVNNLNAGSQFGVGVADTAQLNIVTPASSTPTVSGLAADGLGTSVELIEVDQQTTATTEQAAADASVDLVDQAEPIEIDPPAGTAAEESTAGASVDPVDREEPIDIDQNTSTAAEQAAAGASVDTAQTGELIDIDPPTSKAAEESTALASANPSTTTEPTAAGVTVNSTDQGEPIVIDPSPSTANDKVTNLVTKEELAGQHPSTGSPVNSSTNDKSIEVDPSAAEEAKHTSAGASEIPSAGRKPEDKSDDMQLTEEDFTSDSDSEDDRMSKGDKSKKSEVEEEFDKIYYEFMTIVLEKDFNQNVIDKFGGQVTERDKPGDERTIYVATQCATRKKAKQMMEALNELFTDTTRRVYSHSIKLLYEGNLKRLAEALTKDLRGSKLEFIARLVTKTDIRILSYITNLDRDITIVESFVEDFKQKHPAQQVPNLAPEEIWLRNGAVVRIMEGDLTRMKCDAIVSSSGPDLSHKRGVCRAIANSCGQRFMAEGAKRIKKHGLLRVGDVYTQIADGRLKANGVKYVIHAIAPGPEDKPVKDTLIMTIVAALKEADGLVCRTLALPAICMGTINLAFDLCTEAYWHAVDEFAISRPDCSLSEINFVCNDRQTVIDIQNAMQKLAGSASTSVGKGARNHPGASSGANSYVNSPGGTSVDPTAMDRAYANSQSQLASTPTSQYDYLWTSTSNPGVAHRVDTGAGRGNSGGSSGIAGIHGAGAGGTQGSWSGSGGAGAGRGYTGGLSGAAGTQGSWDGSGGAGAGRGKSKDATDTQKSIDEECPICMDKFTNPQTLPCSHKFCKECLDQVISTAKSHLCPTCRTPFRTAEGKQPKGGTMKTNNSHISLPGYNKCGSIVINYNITSGTQGPEHPYPGQAYSGTARTAYLPDNTKGRLVERLLRKAFNQRLVFTIGQSVTTGRDNCVVWNDIHHKTSPTGGPQGYGYPDPGYLDRVIEDLKAKGITE